VNRDFFVWAKCLDFWRSSTKDKRELTSSFTELPSLGAVEVRFGEAEGVSSLFDKWKGRRAYRLLDLARGDVGGVVAFPPAHNTPPSPNRQPFPEPNPLNTSRKILLVYFFLRPIRSIRRFISVSIPKSASQFINNSLTDQQAPEISPVHLAHPCERYINQSNTMVQVDNKAVLSTFNSSITIYNLLLEQWLVASLTTSSLASTSSSTWSLPG
jgi:hypothetical protein